MHDYKMVIPKNTVQVKARRLSLTYSRRKEVVNTPE